MSQSVDGQTGRPGYPLNGLSFDVEDWFHVSNYEGIIDRGDWDGYDLRVEANTRRILDLLGQAEAKATFFMLGWVADRVPDLVRRIQDAGHEIATHGYAHRRLTHQTPAEFRDDLERSLEVLERAGAHEVVGYRAPSFSLVARTRWALEILADFGLLYDSSVFPTGMHPEYGIPDAPLLPYRTTFGIWEVPLSIVEVGSRRYPVAGGAYFRLLPYRVTRWAIRRNRAQGRGVVVYLHPWELDMGQPRPKGAGHLRILRQTLNVSKTEQRLTRLLHDTKFVRLRELVPGRPGDENSRHIDE